MNCDVCSATVTELRRGRCWGCYARWVDARAVGIGARCCVCSERRRETLKSIELLGSWMPMCYTCSGRAMTLTPMPQTLAGIRTALIRERRAEERRGVKRDTRVFQYDRRGDDRRAGRTARGDDWFDIDDGMIVEMAVERVDRSDAPDVPASIPSEPPPIPVLALRPPPPTTGPALVPPLAPEAVPAPSPGAPSAPAPDADGCDDELEFAGLTRIHDQIAI